MLNYKIPWHGCKYIKIVAPNSGICKITFKS